MSKLPRGLSGRVVVAALQRAGFRAVRQKGSHVILRRDSPFAQLVVPDHRTVDTGTLASILRSAGLTPEQFADLL